MVVIIMQKNQSAARGACIGRAFLGDFGGRQGEQVTEAQDAENDRERPP
jgi:hypothetical protein